MSPSPTHETLLQALTALLAGDHRSIPESLEAMLAGLVEAFGADRGMVFLPSDEAPETFEPVSRFLQEGSPLDPEGPVSRKFLRRVAEGDAPVLLASLETRALQEEIASVPGQLCSILAAPFALEERVGVLYLDSVLSRRRFTEDEGALLVAFSRAAGVALRREEERLRATRRHRSLAELHRRELARETLVGESPGMRSLRAEIAEAAAAKVSVLVSGESGTGKELVARALHMQSPRAGEAFVAVNCAAVPAELVESELFGHEEGAFTGATSRRLGRFELADGGTLFLDEVGELPLPVQAKLLRALQERRITRLGGHEEVPVDFRLVSASHVDLEEAVRDKRFREDLFYRLAVFRLRVPPLRDRGGDVLLLAGRFLEEFTRELGKPLEGIDPEAARLLGAHPWPGNVRELRNALEQAVVREKGPRLSAASLRPALGGAPATAAPPPGAPSPGMDAYPPAMEEARRLFEARFLGHHLAAHSGNMKATAAAIGMSRQNLYQRCDELGIDYRAYRG